ncbi:hypothetical protein FLJC2902T_12940 [Flavobacterium limnosediminis JC2902]|uniref:Tetracycline regulation of excision, RteC n=1 Tax=Flavobacterium limnosediminis JC2902 TaxID=1341181 RepID=V6SPU8_9FLAO|nr:RteC domain-containing protein [Flavobacterium limnosediminis]ESU28703.1 hypothetical protein FLJC2902T_12940 [Flavobacterium limnosediminis JC2902]
MNDYCKKAIAELEEHLYFISLEADNTIQQAEIAVNAILQSIEKVKKQILKKGFKSQQEEIHFFKVLKPKFVSKLIYYHTIYNFETRKPNAGNKALQKFISNELESLKRFFDNNLEFYKYYRTGSCFLDHQYFIRGNIDIKLNIDSLYFETDKDFSTTHDFKVAKILANDLIQVYLESKLTKKQTTSKNIPLIEIPTHHPLKWTENKNALIELIYGLHTQGAFNNGKTEIKDIARYFEKMFGIELGDYYRSYLELRSRKISKTKFIDTLRDNLNQRMCAQDE